MAQKLGWGGLAVLGTHFCRRFAAGGFAVEKPSQRPSSNWLGLILVAGGGAGWIFQRRGQPAFAATSLVAMAVVLFVGMFAIAAPPISEQQTSMRFVEAINRFGDKSTPIATYRIRLPDFVYYADRSQPIMGVRLANKLDPRDSLDLVRESGFAGASDPYNVDDTRLWLDNLDNALLITDLEGLAGSYVPRIAGRRGGVGARAAVLEAGRVAAGWSATRGQYGRSGESIDAES